MAYECDNDNHDIGCQCPGIVSAAERLIRTLDVESQRLRVRADVSDDPIKRELLYAEWNGLRRAVFLAKHPDRCQPFVSNTSEIFANQGSATPDET